MIAFTIIHGQSTTPFRHAVGPIEFGRGPPRGAPRRVLEDPCVSRDQLRVEELPGARVRLENLSQRFPVKLGDDSILGPGERRELEMPVRVAMGQTTLRAELVADSAGEPDPFQTVFQPYRPGESAAARLPGETDAVGAEQLARWFETVVSVQRASASSGEFYTRTARAVVELIGLDSGLVLLRRGGDWEVVARHPAEASPGTAYSPSVLARVCAEKRTFFRGPGDGAATVSLMGIDAVVAAPVLDERDRVVGVVYGSRLQRPDAAPVLVRPLEAQLVQVLAATVAAGLARVASEADAARRYVQLEQFFSPELARELDRDPSLLEGRDREVTVVFADIRGFSRVAEQLPPRESCLLVGDVMDRLTERVREHAGVVVGYSGDGLLAMWNAPADQPGHAALACRAALAMHAELPALDARWQDRVGRPLGLGIGLNTGSALVGNIGSRSKFLYGPQGHAVNLASRVEGATKHLGVPILITGATHAQLCGAFATRRLCRARVVGIEGAVDLHELHAAEPDDGWLARRDAYESGLALYESGRWRDACRTLYPLLDGGGHDDPPTLLLIGRSIECLRAPHRPFDPVIELEHK
jgi:adenylate cyclase